MFSIKIISTSNVCLAISSSFSTLKLYACVLEKPLKTPELGEQQSKNTASFEAFCGSSEYYRVSNSLSKSINFKNIDYFEWPL